jgi:hypothetical protein
VIIAVVVLLVLIYVTALLLGAARWKGQSQELRLRLELARAKSQSAKVDFDELKGLPDPVQRYLRAVLVHGQSIITSMTIRHEGTFNLSETGEQWEPFHSTQSVVTHRPGFVWVARMNLFPGIPVYVHDAYVAGEGLLHASAFGLLTVAEQSGTDEIARGELMRFFAEATWYPTALLPSQGVSWQAVDEHSSRGTLNDGAVSVTLLFTFSEDGLVENVVAESRARTVAGKVEQNKWRGRFWDYENRNGMLVPIRGEVSWLFSDGDKPYWRGTIIEIEPEFAN